ncbi:hypothetical protein AVEN_4956-1 [Araneus ventricosus]|uniref:Uncharacterized protein n=1 Tax=Araneus ventricosus TaxID=182803 RepID=A0A4Y2E795_ARAVE|nr:hypothetical protein AVEN_4956-1 [Araneus ventricosus]
MSDGSYLAWSNTLAKSSNRDKGEVWHLLSVKATLEHLRNNRDRNLIYLQYMGIGCLPREHSWEIGPYLCFAWRKTSSSQLHLNEHSLLNEPTMCFIDGMHELRDLNLRCTAVFN